MKKLIYTLVSVLFLSLAPEMLSAQSNDPFEQETLKSSGNTVAREKKISRKKSSEPDTKTPAANTSNSHATIGSTSSLSPLWEVEARKQ